MTNHRKRLDRGGIGLLAGSALCWVAASEVEPTCRGLAAWCYAACYVCAYLAWLCLWTAGGRHAT